MQIHYSPAIAKDMSVLLFDEVPYEEVKPGFKRKIIHTENLMTVLIDFTSGPWDQADPYHWHPHEQTTYVASGEIELHCEGEEPVHLKTGDMFAMPSNVKHSIRLLTEKVRLIDNFTPVREDFLA